MGTEYKSYNVGNCKYENCSRKAINRGYCTSHANKLRASGQLPKIQKKVYGTAQDRFTQKFKINPDTDCWEWTGRLNHDGYGVFVVHKIGRVLSHRFIFSQIHGEIPEDKRVLHKCDNRRCVNPEHLFLGSQKDNILDMVKKDRHVKHKLSLKEAADIKRSCLTNTEIAEIFAVSKSLVLKIKRGICWKNA